MNKLKLGALILLSFILLAGIVTTATGQTAGNVLVLNAEGPVSAVMVSYIERGIAAAEAQNAAALVIQLDTPGGQTDLTRDIMRAIINSNVPVVVYVYPPGGFAASAGTFITLAGHIAAMAPQTSIGAASPVDGQGGDIGETMRAKIENILVADMENLAARRGEDVVQWATEAITEAKAASAAEALELGVIDVMAGDLPDLLAQIDGREVTVRGQTRVLHTTGAPIVEFEMTLAEEILAVLLRPEIAFILLAIGPLAIIYELASPGGYIGGIIGVICLVLGLYAVGQLPINFAGAALILLAFILFTADAFAPTHGALTTAGVISLLLGGLLLFDEATLGYRIPITPIVATSVILGLFFFFVVGKIVATLNMKPASGMERLMGATVIARTPLAPTGTVFADGARWQATIEDGVVEAGEPVEVVAVHGLKLTVRKTTPPSPAPPAGSPSPPPAEQSTGTSPAESPD